jgi:hypothetical protein
MKAKRENKFKIAGKSIGENLTVCLTQSREENRNRSKRKLILIISGRSTN